MFYFDEICGKKVLKSDLLNTEHCFTTRESVIKTKEADFTELVEQNKKMFCDYLKVPFLLTPSQTHTSHIEVANTQRTEYPDTDGLIVADNNVAVFLNFADCTPVILYDSKKNIGAVSHAGWRGTAGKIAPKTVQKMQKEFACEPKDIIALIGPAISMCCYNVGEEVFQKLKATVGSFDGLYEMRQGELYVDLKGINARQLEECGVETIDVCPYCTCCDNDMFFSYRKENATTNRHSAILKIN